MENLKTNDAVRRLDAKVLFSVVARLTGSDLPNPEDDAPPGPWGPVIRAAIEHVERLGPYPEPWISGIPLERFGPYPEPWKTHITARDFLRFIANLDPRIWEIIVGPLTKAGLNPQPLPPRLAFMNALTSTVARRAELMQDIGEAIGAQGDDRGIIVVGGRYVANFTDDLCPPPPKKPKIPKPWPPPPDWFPEEIDWLDLITMGTGFYRAARETANASLRESFDTAAARFAEAGLARM